VTHSLQGTGKFFVIAAPSGAGKTSLVNALIKKLPEIKISISYTTRPPRQNEIHGEHYHFIDDVKFTQMTNDEIFLEHAQVFGYQYGTSREWVMRQLEKGIDVVLEIDWQGARQIRQLFSSAVSIYILPPSLSVLKQRLMERKQDSLDVIQKRMQAAQLEMSHFHEFDYVVVNEDFNQALDELSAIVRAERLHTVVAAEKLASILANLLGKQ
jgi:guanylate kinase